MQPKRRPYETQSIPLSHNLPLTTAQYSRPLCCGAARCCCLPTASPTSSALTRVHRCLHPIPPFLLLHPTRGCLFHPYVSFFHVLFRRADQGEKSILINQLRPLFLCRRQLRLPRFRPHHQARGPTAHRLGNCPPVTLDELLSLVAVQALQHSRDYKHLSRQTVWMPGRRVFLAMEGRRGIVVAAAETVCLSLHFGELEFRF